MIILKIYLNKIPIEKIESLRKYLNTQKILPYTKIEENNGTNSKY